MDLKRIIKILFVLCAAILMNAQISTAHAITFFVEEGAYYRAYGNGVYGSGAKTYSFDNYHHKLYMSYPYPSQCGMWIGLTKSNEGMLKNLSGYTRVIFEAKSINSKMSVFLKDINNNESKKYLIENMPQDTYATYVIPAAAFSQAGFDVTQAKEILFSLDENNASEYKLTIKNIRFDDNEGPADETFYLEQGAYPTGNGSWGTGSGYSFDNYHHILNTSESKWPAQNGIWLGTKGDNQNADLSLYKRLLLVIKSQNGEFFVRLKDTNNNLSPKYKIFNVSTDSNKEYEIPLLYFSQDAFDISETKEIIVEMNEYADYPQYVYIKNIRFDKHDLTTGELKTPLKEALFAKGLLPNAPPKLTSDTNYTDSCQHLWNAYKNRFIDSYKQLVTSGNHLEGLIFDAFGGASKTRLDSADIAKSEGSGYGMLIAVYMNDQKAFNELAYATISSPMHKTNSSKLFAWNIKTDGTFLRGDSNSAIDADQDIAVALIFADTLVRAGIWQQSPSINYEEEAQSLLDSIYTHGILVLNNKKYLMPSDESGPSGNGFVEVENEANPSYFSPAWYRIFELFDRSNHNWHLLIDNGYQLIASADRYNKGLAPDWCDFWGRSLDNSLPLDPGIAPKSSFYTYMLGKDSIRVNWRLITDYLWFGEPRAKQFLDKTADLFSGDGETIAPAAITPLEMDGSPAQSRTIGGALYEYNYTDISLASMFAVGSMSTQNLSYRSIWKQSIDSYLDLSRNGLGSFLGLRNSLSDQKIDFDAQFNYYNHSLGILGLLIMDGAFPYIMPSINISLISTTCFDPVTSSNIKEAPGTINIMINCDNLLKNNIHKVTLYSYLPESTGLINQQTDIAPLEIKKSGDSIYIRMQDDLLPLKEWSTNTQDTLHETIEYKIRGDFSHATPGQYNGLIKFSLKYD